MITIIYVTSLDGTQQEPLSNISDDFKMEQTIDGTFNVSFTCFNSEDNAGYELITSESTITVDGYDFIVKQISQSAFNKRITAISSFYEQSKKYVHGELNGTHTLQQRLEFVFNGSGWSYTVDGTITDNTAFMSDFGRSNRVALIRKICEFYGCEFEIRRDKSLHFTKQIGIESDEPFMYKHNVSSVVLREDTTNLYTKIVGYGANGLTVTYTSPNTSVFGELEAQPVSDDRYTDSANLLAYLKQQIVDVPEIAIETSIPRVTKRGLGDRVWMIYDPLKIEMETRILQQTLILRDGELVTASVVLGNAQPKTTTDLILEQKEAHNTLSNEAVKQEQLYNGVEITKENGVVVSANNGVALMLNATQGILLTRNGLQKFYVDTDGNVVMDGKLKITSNGVTMLESFMDVKGGRLIINDVSGKLNVKIGSEDTEDFSAEGGVLKLFSDSSDTLPKVELAATAAYECGRLRLANRWGQNAAKLNVLGESGGELELTRPGFQNRVYASNGEIQVTNSSYQTTIIRGDEILVNLMPVATQSWVWSQGYVTANTVQAMIDAALPSE